MPHDAEALRSSLKVRGYPKSGAIPLPGELVDIAAEFSTGAVLERRLDQVRWRTVSPAVGN